MKDPKTFTDLKILQATRLELKKELKKDYVNRVTPFVELIQLFMKNRDLNEFEAAKLIQDEGLFKQKQARIFIASALMEIVESKRLNAITK